MKVTFLPFLLLAIVITPISYSEVPLAISYQAALTDDSGAPLSQDEPTNYSIKFRIYDSLQNGNRIWSESQNISVFQGGFSTLLGTGDTIEGEARPQLDTVFNGAERYLEVTITEGGGEKTFTPRQQMASTPFAFRARTADNALSVADLAIGTGQIAQGSITSDKIGSGQVTSDGIQDDVIVSADIKDGAIGSADLADSSILLEKLAAEIERRLVPAGTVSAWAGIPTEKDFIDKDGNILSHNNGVADDTSIREGYSLVGVPDGWIICDGRSLRVADYPELFAAFGYLYGSSESGDLFQLPDYRGYFLRGQSAGVNRDPNSGNRSRSNWDWAVNNSINEGSTQEDEFKSHIHTQGNVTGRRAVFVNNKDTAGSLDNTDPFPLDEINLRSSTPLEHRGGSETRPVNRYVWYIVKAH